LPAGVQVNISNQELIELSTKIEREGKAFYRELAQYTLDPEVKEFLDLMVKEEALHEAQFKKLLSNDKIESFGWENDPTLREMINTHFQTDIFPSVNEILEQLPHFEGMQKSLDFAVEAEKVAAEFYRLLGESCDDIEIKTQLVKLEKAESEHLERIQALIVRYNQK